MLIKKVSNERGQDLGRAIAIKQVAAAYPCVSVTTLTQGRPRLTQAIRRERVYDHPRRISLIISVDNPTNEMANRVITQPIRCFEPSIGKSGDMGCSGMKGMVH